MKKHVICLFALISVYSLHALAPRSVRLRKESVTGMHDVSAVKGFDERVFSEKRKKEVVTFVDKAVRHLADSKITLNQALNDFSHDKHFVSGEIYLFVYDFNGICLAHGEDQEIIWSDRSNYRDVFGTAIIKVMIEKAKRGGGWVNYQRRNATKVSYVKLVEKGDKRFIVGAGFYPLSKKDSVIALVKGAVEHFKNEINLGESPKSAFSELSYPLGRFVLGDLYLFALDWNGLQVAHGDRPGLIGTNAIDYKDESGKFVNKEIIEQLTLKDRGIWVEYVSKGAPKRTYAEKVIDKSGKKYFIACGYYPETDRRRAVDMVKRGYTFMEKNGISAAATKFSSRKAKDFRYGDLWLFIYNYTGKCIAHGTNRDYMGINRYNVKDEDGRFFVREFIEKAKGGGGWVDYKVKNSYRFVYVEPVEVGAKNYVLGCGVFPISKPESMQLLVKGAAGNLRGLAREQAFAEFIKKGGSFVKGDLNVFAFDFSGICYAYGSDYSRIWRNMLEEKDENGRPFVKLIINTAKEGSGIVVYKERGKEKTVYVMRVEKDGVSYAVGSGFFTS